MYFVTRYANIFQESCSMHGLDNKIARLLTAKKNPVLHAKNTRSFKQNQK